MLYLFILLYYITLENKLEITKALITLVPFYKPK